MTKLIIKITRGNTNYGAWVEGVPGIYDVGNTVNEVKANILRTIELYKKNNSIVPDVLKGDFAICWEFDTASYLEYISVVFTKSGLSRITGINQKQLGHYSSGLKKPRYSQIKKIDEGIKQFVEDLSQINLV